MQAPQNQKPEAQALISLRRSHIKNSDKFKLLLSCDHYFEKKLNRQLQLTEHDYNVFSIIDAKDEDKMKFVPSISSFFKQGHISPRELGLDLVTNRGVACFLGLAICDALGACTEFVPFQKDRRDLVKYDFKDIESQIKNKVLDARSGARNIWTDDCSMALCVADSLLLNDFKFDPKHMRFMFQMWLQHGLNNGGRRYSIGLGGNISISMTQFCHQRNDYTAEGDRFNNGNGSLMRLAPVPLCFLDNQAEAMEYSGKQSRTTHNGDEAKQCSRLLALLLVRLIKRPHEENWREVIETACKEFAQTTIPTVKHLALSEQEPPELYQEQVQQYGLKFKRFNQKLEDRNWNWKDPGFTYSACRTKHQPHYIGSYCMDALAMALHTVWHNPSFKEVALVNANMGGDCDTVGAIAGQLAGAIYGIDEYMMHLYGQMEDCISGRCDVFLKAYKLVTRRAI